MVDAVSLALGPTGATAILGPNGAGKSTLLRTLAGLLAPDDGVITVDAKEPHTLHGPHRARSIGYIPQVFAPHWDLDVAELLALGAARVPGTRQEALDRAVRDFELGALLKHRWSTLSGGERAHVLLAMVLVVEPRLVLADEPAASLDLRHRVEVVRRLAAFGRERPVAVVMHDVELAFHFFDRVVLMSEGRVVLDGSAAEVAASTALESVFNFGFKRETRGARNIPVPVIS